MEVPSTRTYKAEMIHLRNEKMVNAIEAVQNRDNQKLWFKHNFLDVFYSNEGELECLKSISLAKKKWKVLYQRNHLCDFGVENIIGEISDEDAKALVSELMMNKDIKRIKCPGGGKRF